VVCLHWPLCGGGRAFGAANASPALSTPRERAVIDGGNRRQGFRRTLRLRLAATSAVSRRGSAYSTLRIGSMSLLRSGRREAARL